MKALIYTKENGDVSSIMDSEGIGYEGLLTRLPLNCTDIIETTDSELEGHSAFNVNAIIIKKSEADAKRDELLTSDFEYRGAMFQCDDVSVRNMTVRLAGISNGEIITWRASDNSNHQFSDGDLESMLKIIGERGDQIYIASWLVKADIEAHVNPTSLDIAERFAYHLEQINA